MNKNLPPQFGQQHCHWGQLLQVEVQLDLLNSSFSRGASKLLVSLLHSTSPLSQGDGSTMVFPSNLLVILDARTGGKPDIRPEWKRQ